MTALLEAAGVEKRFGDTVALDGFDLAVAAGEIAGLIGHNGAGKSTFARITAGLVTPDAGGNTIQGPVHPVETSNSIIVADDGALIATLGVDSLVIVQSAGATLVARLDQLDRLKSLVEGLEKAGFGSNL